VPLESAFYVVRPTDEEFRAAVARRDSIVLVKGAHQMGKTSLLGRGLQQARESGARVIQTDLRMLDAADLESVERLLRALAEWMVVQAELEVSPGQIWKSHLGPSVNFARFMRGEVLGASSTPVVWGLDEVDRLSGCDFGSQVFALFRSWHNERVLDPQGPWARLTLAMAYATEAHLFITDVNLSPFTVGTQVTLHDFTLEHVAELNRRYGSPLRSERETARFHGWLGGQPYLVRRGLHEMAARGLELETLEAEADRDDGIFSDHLRHILIPLARDTALCDAVRTALKDGRCPTEERFYRLRSAGVLVGDSSREVQPRCPLYARYLGRRLP
jgi:hypothetical protein